jgi:hypothetical protein
LPPPGSTKEVVIGDRAVEEAETIFAKPVASDPRSNPFDD